VKGPEHVRQFGRTDRQPLANREWTAVLAYAHDCYMNRRVHE
jgi:hypothetical protein